MNSKSRRLQAGMCLILLCILRSQCTPRASTCMGVGRLNEGGLTKHDGLGHKCQLLVECQTATDTLQHNTYACRARTEKIRGGGGSWAYAPINTRGAPSPLLGRPEKIC